MDDGLLLFCMRSSVTYEVAEKMGQPVASEFFADREYNDDGQIVFTRAVTEELDPDEVGERVVRAVVEGKVTTESGKDIELPPTPSASTGTPPARWTSPRP